MFKNSFVLHLEEESRRLAVGISDSESVADLVRLARSGDKDAFRELVLRHQNAAGGVAFGILGDTHLAADAVQDSFVKAWQRLNQLGDDRRFSGWFLQIVRSSSIDLHRRRSLRGREKYSIDETRDISPGMGPEESLEQVEKSQMINNLLLELPAEYREVLLLKHQLNHSYQEIARIQGTTPKAVESKIARARKLLAEKWRRANSGGEGEFDGRS